MNYLSTIDIAKLCGCTRVWAWKKARDGMIPFKRLNRKGKHYRYEDSPKIRAWCAAIKADRERARVPKQKSRLVGVSTWHGLAVQFDILRRQIGEKWRGFDKAQVASIREQIKPILAFDRQLSNLR